MENTALLLSSVPTLQELNASIANAYSIMDSATPISITVQKRFIRNAEGKWSPVQGEASAVLKVIATELRSFSGIAQNVVVRGFATETVTLPGGYQVDRGDFIGVTLLIGNNMGELQHVITPNGAAGDLKYEFDSLADAIPEFGNIDILTVPYACR